MSWFNNNEGASRKEYSQTLQASCNSPPSRWRGEGGREERALRASQVIDCPPS